MKPMLASNAKRDLLTDDEFVCEPKIDGRRILLTVEDDKIAGWGRDGQRANVPDGVARDLGTLNGQFTVDGELLGDQVIAFDVLGIGGGTFANSPLERRRRVLEDLMGRWQPENIHLIPQAKTRAEKGKMLRRVKRNRGEGVVFKRFNSPYEFGVRSKNWVKHKLTKDLDVVILDRGTEKENFTVGLWDGEAMVPVGEVASFTGDGPALEIGDVATITLLYVTPSGRMVSPVRPVKRTDKAPKECTLDQFDGLVPSKDYILRWTK